MGQILPGVSIIFNPALTQEALRHIKKIADKTKDAQRRIKEFTSEKSNAFRQGASYAEKSASKTYEKGEIKSAKKTVKTSQRAVKGSFKSVKTTIKTAKTTQKTVQAAAKTAQAARSAISAAKATAAVAKAFAKAITITVKVAIAAIKSLITAIAAGGWVAVVVIIVVAVIAMIVGSAFGIFFSDETGNGISIKNAVAEITADYQAKINSKINELSHEGTFDDVKVVYEGDFDGDSSSINNWSDVLTVFAVKYMGENVDVINITSEKVEELKNVFNTMNYFTTRTETKSEEVIIINSQGEEETRTKTTLFIYIKYTSLTYEEAMPKYRFTPEQIEIADEMMSPAYYKLFADLLGVDLYDGTDLTKIVSNLPVGSEGSDVVKEALTRLGAPYVWGAKGETSFDCSGLVYWSIAQVDPALGSKMYTDAADQAKYCFDCGYIVGQSELVPGDLVFWQNLSCPGCGRWNEIHHTGIYIGDGKVIEASSSNGRVIIRNLWSSPNYPLYMFARPYSK